MAENSSDKIRLKSWGLQEIKMEDREMYGWYIRRSQCPVNLWSSNFAYLWAVSQSKNRTLLWKIIDGLLVTFAVNHKNQLYIYCLPFGNADPEQLIDVTLTSLHYCLDWNHQDKQNSVIRMVNEDQLRFLKKSPRFLSYFKKTVWTGIERHFDILKLVSLQGKEFDNIRNRVHKFRKDHPDAQICPYRDGEYKELLALDAKWRNTSGKKYARIFDGVYYKELVRHGRELGQETIVVKDGGSIIGMISGGVLPTGQAWGSVMKFEANHPGLSETLIVEFAKWVHERDPEVRFMNVGSDLGPGGLRDYKLKFRPALNFKRYQVSLK